MSAPSARHWYVYPRVESMRHGDANAPQGTEQGGHGLCR
jgi:hypothetical protein